jgi:hypothetical protein
MLLGRREEKHIQQIVKQMFTTILMIKNTAIRHSIIFFLANLFLFSAWNLLSGLIFALKK